MEIVSKTGKKYDLGELDLNISRLNPFFNDYGEQSLPVTLPPSENNLSILKDTFDMSTVNKVAQRTDAVIRHGLFSIPCRQAILSANKSSGIETSFYMNTGAFYEKINDVPLSTVFENKVITFASQDEALQFIFKCATNLDQNFIVFPVRTKKIALNYYNLDLIQLDNMFETVQKIDDKYIRVPKGFFLTPFIKVNHLLTEIFSYFGYKLNDSFFSLNDPFKNMVLLNNNIDTIVKNEIRYTQIVPSCTVKDLLDVFRNKFCCEFIPDEVNKQINIVLFKDVINADPTCDISNCVVGNYTITQPENYKQLKLSCDRVNFDLYSSSESGSSVVTSNKVESGSDEFESVIDLLKKYPAAEYNNKTGEFIRNGYKGIESVQQRIGSIDLNYIDKSELTTEEKNSKDVMPCMYPYNVEYSEGMFATGTYIYVGEERELNSTLVMDSVNDTSADVVTSTNNSDLGMMLCFAYAYDGWNYGTISNYDKEGNKLWNYTLGYHGPEGLFESFWRDYDSMLRNSFIEITVNLMLNDIQKVTLSEYKKVVIYGQQLLPKEIKYSPNKNNPFECTFLTTKLYNPISSATLESERFNFGSSKYKWQINYSYSNSSPDKSYFVYDEEPVTVYYAPPTTLQYATGGKYFESIYPGKFYWDKTKSGDPETGTLTVWFTPVLAN